MFLAVLYFWLLFCAFNAWLRIVCVCEKWREFRQRWHRVASSIKSSLLSSSLLPSTWPNCIDNIDCVVAFLLVRNFTVAVVICEATLSIRPWTPFHTHGILLFARWSLIVNTYTEAIDRRRTPSVKRKREWCTRLSVDLQTSNMYNYKPRNIAYVLSVRRVSQCFSCVLRW